MPPTRSSKESCASSKNEKKKKDPSPAVGKPKIRVVVKRRRKSKHIKKLGAKPGLPNLTKELTEAPPDESENADEDEFAPLEDAIPCDTLLAFQSLTADQSLHLTIPLQASLEPIACVLESQLVPVLQHTDNHDAECFEMVTRELPELMRQNTLRRLASISTPGTTDTLSVLLLTREYIRGVWDAHDTAATEDSTPEKRELQRSYVDWWVTHLHCWTGRLLTESQLHKTWSKDPPRHNLPYALVPCLTQALAYFQNTQILLAQHDQRGTYQLWLPQWGTVVSAVFTAQKKFTLRLNQTYQKEVSQQTLLQQPHYKGVSIRLLLQWMQDQGKVRVEPKPFGKFVKLVSQGKKKTTKR